MAVPAHRQAGRPVLANSRYALTRAKRQNSLCRYRTQVYHAPEAGSRRRSVVRLPAGGTFDVARRRGRFCEPMTFFPRPTLQRLASKPRPLSLAARESRAAPIPSSTPRSPSATDFTHFTDSLHGSYRGTTSVRDDADVSPTKHLKAVSGLRVLEAVWIGGRRPGSPGRLLLYPQHKR